LTFHQALGRGVFSFLEKRDGSDDDVEKIHMKQVLGLLELLLPASTAQSREAFARKVFDMTVAFKRAMMEESALYRVFWIDCDVAFHEDLVNLVDDDPTSRILVCTFPGLARIDKVDGREEVKHIDVKASARLKSSFERRA
jgi:hypothetical protein